MGESNRCDGIIECLQQMCEAADFSGNGTLSWRDLECQLEDPKVRAHFRVLELEPWDLMTFFDLLKRPNEMNPSISIPQFIRGCIRLKQQAKNVDIVSVKYVLEAEMAEIKLTLQDLLEVLDERY